MKEIRFYLEHASPADKRKKNHEGNVFARFLDIPARPGKTPDAIMVEGVGAVYKWANSGVATTSVSLGYLWNNCTRISEARARVIHPALFAFLDED